MHDNSVSSGDTYIKNFFVGALGTLSVPAPGSLLASNLFSAGHRTLLILWWDENSMPPELFYGSVIKPGFMSSATAYDHFATLHLIENNWGLPTLTSNDAAAVPMSEFYTTVTPPPLSNPTFTVNPTSPSVSQPVAFTASVIGGVPPFTYIWNFGDASVNTVVNPTSHTYSSAGSFTVTLTISDSALATVSTTQVLTVTPLMPLTTVFKFLPLNPTVGTPVTFTALPSGGISPYTYAWTFGDTGTSTVNPALHTYLLNKTFTVGLTVTDSALATASTLLNITIGPAPPPPTNPVIIGWGGVALHEVAKFASGNPASQVFPGTTASDFEFVLQTMQVKGMNGVRVSWDPSCTTSPSPIGSSYSSADVATAIQIAQFYHFWIILDNHGYKDVFTATSCWLSFWSGVTSQFATSYSQIIWEPENEPNYGGVTVCSGATACTAYLSTQYQTLINTARSQGDQHYIIVQNVCSFGCSFCPTGNGDCLNAVNGYPTVTDPVLGHIFISLHTYMSPTSTWTNATADANAQAYYNTIVAGTAKTGWLSLNTEGGADALLALNPPNIILTGSAGYSLVTFRFTQTLTNLFDRTSVRIGYLWWPAGDWTNTAGAGALGALQCNSSPKGWGCLLTNVPVGPVAPLPPDFTITVNPAAFTIKTGVVGIATITISPINGFTGTVSLAFVTNSTNLACTLGTSSLSCSSAVAGNYLATVTGTSGTLSHSATVVYHVTTTLPPPPPVNTPPTLTVPGPVTAKAGSTVTFTVTGADTDGDVVTLTTSTMPSGASFNASTGVFTWTTTAAQAGGTFTISFTATDSVGLSVTKQVQITVTT
jgi:PKD repeat protein